MKRKLKDKYVVESTYSYTKFKDLLGNREDKEKRKKNVLKSIEEVGLIPAPIIVNEKSEVVDGQARLAAFEELGLPVYYMRVNGLTLEDCIAMNKTSKAWSLKDYVNSFAQTGSPDYQVLKQFIEKYGKLSMDVITWALCGHTYPVKTLREGDFQIDYAWVKDADCILKEIAEMLDGITIHGHITNLQLALGYCLKNPKIDNTRLKDRFRKNHWKFNSYSTTSDWIKAVDDVYNFKTKRDFQVPIRALWEMDWKERRNTKKTKEDEAS